MNRLLRILAVLFAFALIAAACGGGEEDLADDPVDTAETEEEDEAEVAESVTSEAETAPPTSTSTAPDEDETEEEELPVGNGTVFPLTGEPVPADQDADRAAVVVKLSNNDANARAALDGLDEADIIYEERIEVEATRFAAVFHSALPEQVGSVRSGRTSDIQIVANLNRPVFAFSGANDGVHGQLRTAETDGFLLRASADFGDPQFSRISEFSAPDNLVADVSRLASVAPEDSEAPRAVFDYSNNVADLGRRSPGVRAEARTDAEYVWSGQAGGYLRFQGGAPLQTRDGVQLTPENVVILTTTYVPSQIDSQSVDAVTIGEGRVEVYSDGSRVVGTWSRAFPRDPFTLTSNSGEVIGLAPGQTWVSLAPPGTAAELTDGEADALADR